MASKPDDPIARKIASDSAARGVRIRDEAGGIPATIDWRGGDARMPVGDQDHYHLLYGDWNFDRLLDEKLRVQDFIWTAEAKGRSNDPMTQDHRNRLAVIEAVFDENDW